MYVQKDHHIRVAPLYGDGEILLSLAQSKFWSSLMNKNEKSWLILVRELFRIKFAILAFLTGAIFRYGYGSRTIGFILSILSTLMLIGYNSTYLFWVAKPFFPFTAAFFIPFVDLKFWQELVVTDIHSTGLFYYTCLFAAVSLFHSLSIYLGFGNSNDPTKRGNSIIYMLFFRYTRVPEYLVQGIMEPVIIGITALLCWHILDDKHFSIFLIISGSSLFMQETLDKANLIKHRVAR
ncbi:MAG: hypothetical protein JNK00_00305 [Flavipsychrobacter sp.]|nr:hypothetical protein [Flavipsychrobacter sp.]